MKRSGVTWLTRGSNALRAVVALALSCLVPAPVSALDASLESVVKATFLHRFPSFVDWPEGHFTQPGEALILCIAGRDPFGDVIDQAVEGERATGRMIELRRMDVARRGTGCDVMFIGDAPQQSVARSLRLISGERILTVTDQSVAPARGIIHFEIVDDRVRFHIDEARASREGFGISSRLLGLALTVRRREAG